MKRKLVLKRGLAIILASCMVIGGVGCGKNNNDSQVSGNDIDENVSKYTYVANYKPIDINIDYISKVKLTSDKIYVQGIKNDIIEKEHKDVNATDDMIYDTEYISTIKIYSMDKNGDDLNNISFELEENENILDFNVNEDGNIITLLQKYIYQDIKEENDDVELEDKEENIDISDDIYFEDEYVEPEQIYTLKTFSQDGKELNSKELDLKKLKKESYLNRLIITDDGNICCSTETKIFIYDLKGKLISKLNIKDDYIEDLIVDYNNRIYYKVYSENGYLLKEIDMQNKEVINEYKIGSSNNIYFYNIIPANSNEELYDFYLMGDMGLYGYNLDTQEVSKLLNWLDCDINSNTVDQVIALDEEQIICFINNYDSDNNNNEFIKLKRMLTSEVEEKQILTLVSNYTSSELKKTIINFNKKNDKYRIRLLDYTEYEDSSTQINADLMAGRIPDIVNISYMPIENYISKGIFTDLYPIMEKDPDLNKEEFVEEILKTLEKNGKLYYMPSFFNVKCLIGNKNDIGEKESWNINDMKQLYESKPKGTKLMEYMSNTRLLSDTCYNSLSEYVDWDTGKCNFNSEDFIKLLEFSNSFPSEEKMYEEDDYVDIYMSIKKGKILLEQLNLGDFYYYKLYKTLFGKDNYKIIGYPTSEGTGIICDLAGELNFGITEKCKNKEAAWEFVKTILSYEYQKQNNYYGLPIRKDVLEKKLEQAMATKEYIDEDGNKVEPQEYSYWTEDGEIKLGVLNQEEVDEIKHIISQVDRCSSYSQTIGEIVNIITEEANVYFDGKKSAKEIADIIQSRVTIYVNENM